MSLRKLKVSKKEAENKISDQLSKCMDLSINGRKEIEKGHGNTSQDVFKIEINQWEYFTFEILKEIFVSSKYANEFKNVKSNQVKYVSSRWVADIKYYIDYHLAPKRNYLEVLLGNLNEFDESDDGKTKNPIPKENTLANKVNLSKVFVVHGRNLKAKDEMFKFLRALNLQPMEWSEAVALTGKGSPYSGEVVEAAFAVVQAVVLLLTGDELVRLGTRYTESNILKNLELQPRPNVLYEAGMAFGLHPDRTIIVQLGKMRDISDILGRNVVLLSNDPKKKWDLVSWLKTAKCDFDVSHKSDWIDVGDFESCVVEPDLENTTKNATPQPSPKFELSEQEIKILEYLNIFTEGGNDKTDASGLNTALSLGKQKITYYLTKLVEMELVDDYIDLEQPTKYGLSDKGLAYLVENKLI